MTQCERCRERLLDYVYGLLEEGELRPTREHLDACTQCQEALAAALKEQTLIARAARAVTEVPEFILPTELTPAEPALPATLPMPLELPKRSRWKRPWLAWTVAAAVLVALSAGISWHRSHLR